MKRRISLVVVMGLCAILSQAQDKSPRSEGITFGLRAGVNFQNITGKDEDGNKLDNDMFTGFNVGVNAEIPLAPLFYFQPGVIFTVKGAKNKEIIQGETIKNKVKISYVELPLNLLYKPTLGSGNVLLGFGPYIGYAVGGHVKYKDEETSQKQEITFQNTVKTSDPDDKVYFKPVDAGINLLAGYEFDGKFSFQLNTQLGLTKINPTYENASNDNTVAKHTGFGFSFGYRL